MVAHVVAACRYALWCADAVDILGTRKADLNGRSITVVVAGLWNALWSSST